VSKSGGQDDQGTYICDAGNAHTLELTAIELFYRSFQIGSSLELNEASRPVSNETQGIN
jgi:hypothetical protein